MGDAPEDVRAVALSIADDLDRLGARVDQMLRLIGNADAAPDAADVDSLVMTIFFGDAPISAGAVARALANIETLHHMFALVQSDRPNDLIRAVASGQPVRAPGAAVTVAASLADSQDMTSRVGTTLNLKPKAPAEATGRVISHLRADQARRERERRRQQDAQEGVHTEQIRQLLQLEEARLGTKQERLELAVERVRSAADQADQELRRFLPNMSDACREMVLASILPTLTKIGQLGA